MAVSYGEKSWLSLGMVWCVPCGGLLCSVEAARQEKDSATSGGPVWIMYRWPLLAVKVQDGWTAAGECSISKNQRRHGTRTTSPPATTYRMADVLGIPVWRRGTGIVTTIFPGTLETPNICFLGPRRKCGGVALSGQFTHARRPTQRYQRKFSCISMG